MTRLETVFNEVTTEPPAGQLSATRKQINQHIARAKSDVLSPEDLIATCMKLVSDLSPQQKSLYLQPVIHCIDGFFRTGKMSAERVMGHLENIRHHADILQMDFNTQNILRGWTVRREDKPHSPKP